ncbi:SDR family NAD(P)-dependent oxidoreductase [Silvanigrella paludirubra]|uniref:SDR family NAD(P)-dependent oxidoreductase n=1 Tax=Silvanigrella paludirubra TaxID=2499159 RepID=A0A6N6VYM5_9BACT|nr:SDR family oxidoreductase [Silvanigrella paludirubra]KAB8039996.1 SDR family NAD(P)-dependent oxidoreductase [Silvanigrella paludirubra]
MKISEIIKSKPKIIETEKKPIALVTGASSGIGYSFTCLLASKGYDVIAIARDHQRLYELENKLLTKFNAKIYVLPLDLSINNSVDKIAEFLKKENLMVDVLINNAGFGVHGAFHETELQKELNMVNLQIQSTLSLTKLVLPYMQERRSGFILNVGSVYSFSPVPFQSVYGGCKSFLLSFGTSLAHENKKYKINVTTLCPGITQTEFRIRSNIGKNINSIKHKKTSGMSADLVAEQGYKALMRGDLICIPGLTNRIFVQIATHLPTSLFSSALTLVNSFRGVNSKNS